MKKSKFTLIALTAALAVSASALSFTAFAAENDPRKITLDGTNVFYAAVDGAEVAATRITSDGDTHNDYAYFRIEKDETVTFRKSLAYSWFEADETYGSVNKTFNMEIGFKEVEFDSYTLKFQSQQYAKTKEGITENYLIFKPEGEALALYISQTEEIEEGTAANATVQYADNARISVAFGAYDAGEYEIIVNGASVGSFENISQNYSKYVSSGSNAVTPLTFSAQFGQDAAESAVAGMVMYSLNGQSFEVFEATEKDGEITGGHILDNLAPVLCLNSNVNYFNYGGSINADYAVIDVVASSPRAVENYYVLTREQYEADGFDYERTTSEEGQADLFRTISSSSTVKLLRDHYTFVPDECIDANSGIVEIDGYKTYGLVKVYLTLKDTTSSNAQTTEVFLDWYVDDDYKVDIADLKNDGSASCDFIRIVEDKEGAAYAEGATSLEEYKAAVEDIEREYQAKIDALIAQTEDGKLHAGSDSYFYLPDYSGYISDNLGGYTDLKYSIYYYASSSGSNTSLAYNNLSIALTEANVNYRFTVYATDAAGNAMYYPESVDENGEVVYGQIDKDKIWDADYADLLPFFEFPVAYRSATVEDPGVQKIGYVGTTYNSVSFEIEGIPGTYKTEYSLYVFDRNAYYDEHNDAELTYEQVVENAQSLFNNTFIDGGNVNTRKYFKTVAPSSALHSEDEDYKWHSAYDWKPANVTFVPQNASELYVVRLKLTDTGLTNQVTEKFMVIRASARANEIYGEDNWVENNMVSIVLFCIAGVCSIALVVLFIVKPKDKGDVDMIDLDKPEKPRKEKKNKS